MTKEHATLHPQTSDKPTRTVRVIGPKGTESNGTRKLREENYKIIASLKEESKPRFFSWLRK